jgi:hypothetical protein
LAGPHPSQSGAAVGIPSSKLSAKSMMCPAMGGER